MLAFDLPPNNIIAIEYFGLAQQAEIAELQKDLLRRVLGEIIPGDKEFVDATEAPTSALNSGFFLRCIQCDLVSESPPTNARIMSSEVVANTNTASSKKFKVVISNLDHSTKTWSVEVGPRKVTWFASINLAQMRQNTRLETQNFDYRNCLEGINCPKTNLFSSQLDCMRWTEQFLGKKVDVTLAQSLLAKEKFLFPNKVPYQFDVRSQSSVRTIISSGQSSLTIKTLGKALRAGSLGEIIPVEISTPSFGGAKTRQVNARISGEGEVEIVR